MQSKSDDITTSVSEEGTPKMDTRKVALAVALVMSSATASASTPEVAVSSGKPALQSLLNEMMNSSNISGVLGGKSESPLVAEYGRNFENYAKNFENYAKNFENYAKNFENYGRNFENPLVSQRTVDTYSAERKVAALPNGAPVPASIDELLQLMSHGR